MATKPKPFTSFNDFAAGDAKAKKKSDVETIPVRVRATRLGYAGLRRRREGDEFTIHVPKGGKLPSWMEPIDGTEIEIAPVPLTQENAGLDGGSTTSAPTLGETAGVNDADVVI